MRLYHNMTQHLLSAGLLLTISLFLGEGERERVHVHSVMEVWRQQLLL